MEPRETLAPSWLAIDACRKLEAVGWRVIFEDHAMVITHGKLVREVPYSDSLGSLVDGDDIPWYIQLGKRRSA